MERIVGTQRDLPDTGGQIWLSRIVVKPATRGATRDAIPITGVTTADGSMQLRRLQELRTIA